MSNYQSSKTFKSISLCQYLDNLPYSVEEFQSKVESFPHIKKYAFIVHDKDIKQEMGEIFPKSPHIHAYLTFSKSLCLSELSEYFDIPKQYFEFIHDKIGVQAYLIHLNAPEKFQYNEEDIITNYNYHKVVEDYQNSNNITDIINKISTGEIREYQIPTILDIFTYTKYKKKLDSAVDYAYLTHSSSDRDIEVVYIYGGSGLGKTTFAKRYAENLGYSYYVSSSGTNIFDDYQGQDCIIVDDFRGSTLSYSSFIKTIDNHTSSPVACRYHNRSLCFCKLIIITTVMPPQELYKGIVESEFDTINQFYRRVSRYLEFSSSYLLFRIKYKLANLII